MTSDEKREEERRRAKERTVRQIAKTRDSIRKKHRALKTGTMEDEIALEKRLKPIVEPLKQIAKRNEIGNDATTTMPVTVDNESLKDNFVETGRKHVAKRKRDDADESYFAPGMISTPRQPRKRPYIAPGPSSLPFLEREEEDVFDTENESPLPSLEISVRESVRTPRGREELDNQLGPLGRNYVTAFFSGDKRHEIDSVYGVYFGEEGTMLGDKRFDVNADDSIIVNGVRYAGTPGLYELIFKRIPDDTVYNEADRQKYKAILLATNAHKRGHKAINPIMGNKGYKYKHIIAPLMRRTREASSVPSSMSFGTGATRAPLTARPATYVPLSMRLSDNKIDYVHWDDPNELVDRLQLLDASRRTGNNAHDNEILSLIEELREAGFIVN